MKSETQLSIENMAHKYRRHFETSVTPIWHEDISALIEALEAFRAQGLGSPKSLGERDRKKARKLARLIKITDANPAALELFAAKNIRQLRKIVREAYGSGSLDVFIEELEAIWNNETQFESPVNFKTRDGRSISALISMPLPEDPEDHSSVPVMIMDISEQTRANAKQRAIARQTELLLATMQEGVFGLDRQGTITFVNDAAAEALGWANEDLLGQTQHPLIHHSRPDGSPYPPSECPICKTMQSGRGRRIQGEVFWRKDGSSLPVDYTVNPLIDEDEVIGCVMVFHDTSEKLEGAERREQARIMVENTSDSMALVNAEYKIMLANQRYSSDFDLTPSSIKGKHMAELLGHERFETQFKPNADRALAGETLTFRYIENSDEEQGASAVVDVQYSPYRVADEIKGYVVTVRNVTELFGALSKLEASEARYRRLLQNTPIDILEIDTDGLVVDYNRASPGFTEMATTERKKFPLISLADESYQDHLQLLINRALTGETEEFEFSKTNDSGVRIYSANLIPIQNAEEGVESLLGIFQDITERRDAEKLLLESEERFARAFNSNPSGMQVVDIETGQRLMVNDRLCEMTGKSREELMARNATENPLWTDQATLESKLQALRETGEVRDFALTVEMANGETRNLLANSALVNTMVISSIIDITERKVAEHQLKKLVEERTAQLSESRRSARESERRYKESAEIAQLGHWEFDGLNHHFLMVSEVYASLYGYSAEEFLERFQSAPKEYSMIHPEDRERVRSAWSNEDAGKVEFRITDAAGKLRYLKEHFISITNENGEYLYTRGTTQDITDIAETEQALREARDSAEMASKAKAEFLANMSHEIRTPMNAIVGLTHLLSQTQLDGDQITRISKIESSTKHLLTIVNDILDFSKIEAGKLELEQRQFNSHDLLEQVTSLIREEAYQKKISLTWESETLPEHLIGDETRLRQSLINFAGNAIKFTQKGSITIRGLLLQTKGDQHHVRFEVADSGVGINKSKLHTIFESFEQADLSTTREHGGTGLGLAITRRLVELMGGEIGVESEEGKGSVFWFSLWLEEASKETQSVKPLSYRKDAKQELRANYAASRVLLVEDNPINQEVAEELLKSAGLIVEIASDGLQAIAMATQERFDLVLMDIQMPKLDGIEAARRMRESNVRARGGKHLPILAMSANIFVDDRRAATDAGMDDFVAKPVQPENLFKTLIKWLSETGKSVTEEAPKGPKTGKPNSGAEGSESVLEGIPGLDPSVGLRNLSGDLEGFQRLLRQLANSYSEDLEALQADLSNRSFETARQTAHSLKGAAGTLGLVDIQVAAHELESSCQDLKPGDNAEISLEHARGLAQELSRLREALDALNGETQPAMEKDRTSPINPAMLARVFADDDEGRNRLLKVFSAQSRKATSVLEAALAQKDVQTISDQAHKLKSAARSVGAARLADCSVAIESATLGPDWEMLRVLIQKFDRMVQEIEEYIG